jgi:hypothetical protein
MTDWTRKYLQFESDTDTAANILFGEIGGEEERELLLRIRLCCKTYWEDKGRPLPPLDFPDPDEDVPVVKVKAKRGVK